MNKYTNQPPNQSPSNLSPCGVEVELSQAIRGLEKLLVPEQLLEQPVSEQVLGFIMHPRLPRRSSVNTENDARVGVWMVALLRAWLVG